ncbi:MAG: lysylphosphatidylglycerol synthase transmembrane domain-containing protein [Marinobacter sp.]|uniref:lysylphosphatidylglycerol synthase transmembrane domain-containing protein n=1 Tax=Marinobacter sp. TaxID=50741 RepID=UPI0034A02067
MPPWLSHPIVRWLVTGLLLAAVISSLDGKTILDQLKMIAPAFWVAALAVTVVQVGLSAWRWRYTARRLNLELPFSKAIREYYLATFVNQVLPGGVLGDVNRAWRHGTDANSRAPAIHAVMIERLSGQLALALVTVVLLVAFWPFSDTGAGSVSSSLSTGLSWPVFVMAAVILMVIGVFYRRSLAGFFRQGAEAVRRSLFNRRSLVIQLTSSVLVVATYLAVFVILAKGQTVPDMQATTLALHQLLPLSAGLLLAMMLPITIAGWGVREGAAALLWPLAGFPAEQGVALSVAYGLLVLVSSLPGVGVLLSGAGRARQSSDQTTYPNQG